MTAPTAQLFISTVLNNPKQPRAYSASPNSIRSLDLIHSSRPRCWYINGIMLPLSTGAHGRRQQLFHIAHGKPGRLRLGRWLRQAVGPKGTAICGRVYEPVPGDGGVPVERRPARDERGHRQRYQGFRRTETRPRLHYAGAHRHGHRCVVARVGCVWGVENNTRYIAKTMDYPCPYYRGLQRRDSF